MSDKATAAVAKPTTPEVVHLDKQPWYLAEDRAEAREIVSPRNSHAQNLSIADIRIPPGVSVKAHRHLVIEEVYHVVAGTGAMMIEGVEMTITRGDTVVIRPGERHGIRNDTAEELRLVVTCTPPWTPECLVFD